MQQLTATHIQSPCFIKAYSIFSPTDWVQVMDPQQLHLYANSLSHHLWPTEKQSFFSERIFPASNNLKQIAVQYKYTKPFIFSRGLMHIEFLSEHFLQQLPRILVTADQESKAEQIIDIII